MDLVESQKKRVIRSGIYLEVQWNIVIIIWFKKYQKWWWNNELRLLW